MTQTTPTVIEFTTMAKHYIQHGSYVKAWRHTYPHSKAKESTAHVRASEMANTVTFKEATLNMRASVIESNATNNKRSLEAYLDKLDAAYDMAMKEKQAGGAVAALRQAAHMLGHDGKDVDKDYPVYDVAIDDDKVVPIKSKG